jgi:small subunit ribosomal protein S1
MGEFGLWIPGYVPPDEGYWEALLGDEEETQLEMTQAPPAAPSPAVHGNANGHLPEAAWAEDGWAAARAALDGGTVLNLPVVGCNRGGVLVAWNGLRGFVPASHLVRSFSPTADDDERQEELRQLVGTRLSLKVLEVDPEEGRFVLSERAAGSDDGRRQELLNTLSPGDICRGRVTNLCTFGAFVDLNGVEGLVHISELSWGRVDHPSDALQVGQEVEVYVLNVDRDRGRVGLSIKRLRPDPWLSAEERYQVGQLVEGVVTRVVAFGAFVRVEDGLEGLIHVSEVGDPHAGGARWPLREGERVSVRVLNVDSRQRRMALSLRQHTSVAPGGSGWGLPLGPPAPGGSSVP